MIKRMLMTLLCLLLLCGASAGAEDIFEKMDDAMYRIVLRTETEDVTLGSGVLFQDGKSLLTAIGCCAQGDLYAIGNDGEYAVVSRDVYEGAGFAVLELSCDTAGEPLQTDNANVTSLPYVFGLNDQGQFAPMPLYMVRYSMYKEAEGLLISSEEGLLPGAFMTDDKGMLVGLVIAQQMEGIGSYAALDAAAINRALAGDKAGTETFLDVHLSWADGMLQVSWADESRDSGVYIITLSGDTNTYYTTFKAEKTDRDMSLAVPPGHTYYVQVQWAQSEGQARPTDWNVIDILTVPETAFNAYGFTQESYLASVKAGQVFTSTLPEMPLISVDTLTSPQADVYLQVNNQYDVATEIELPMAVELIGPDGQFFFEEMVYVFTPAYEQNDSFAVPVEGMIANCAQFSGGVLRPGAYVLRYALCGQIAGEYAFTVQPAGTPGASDVPETPGTAGFASGLTAVNEKGLVTLSWDASSIPEGAKVNVYYLYEGNTYTTYHPMKEGASSTILLTVPGRRMIAWVVWAAEGDPVSAIPQNQDEMVLVAAANLMPLTDHSFRNLRLSVTASADPAAETGTEFLPEVPLTREILTNRELHFYFQTEDVYTIDETSPDHPMTIVLCTPEGMVFVDSGYYIFDQTLQASDLWLKDITSLFADYESLVQQPWPAGEYKVLYCIDEQLAGEFIFTLE